MRYAAKRSVISGRTGYFEAAPLSPHIIIHDEVSKSERDGFPIDLSSRALARRGAKESERSERDSTSYGSCRCFHLKIRKRE